MGVKQPHVSAGKTLTNNLTNRLVIVFFLQQTYTPAVIPVHGFTFCTPASIACNKIINALQNY